jgi:hypothetical protein
MASCDVADLRYCWFRHLIQNSQNQCPISQVMDMESKTRLKI